MNPGHSGSTSGLSPRSRRVGRSSSRWCSGGSGISASSFRCRDVFIILKNVGVVIFEPFVFVANEAFSDGSTCSDCWFDGCVVEICFKDSIHFSVSSVFHCQDFLFFPCECGVTVNTNFKSDQECIQ